MVNSPLLSQLIPLQQGSPSSFAGWAGSAEGSSQRGAAEVQKASRLHPFPALRAAPRVVRPLRGAQSAWGATKLAGAAEVLPARRSRGGGPAAATHPHQVADSGLHGRHRGGEVRNSLAVHLPLLMHDDQVGDLLGHRLQDALDGACVEDGHGGVRAGGRGPKSVQTLSKLCPCGLAPNRESRGLRARRKMGTERKTTNHSDLPSPFSGLQQPREAAPC